MYFEHPIHDRNTIICKGSPSIFFHCLSNSKCFVWLFPDPPKITHIMNDTIVNDSNTVTLDCQANIMGILRLQSNGFSLMITVMELGCFTSLVNRKKGFIDALPKWRRKG